MPTNLFSVRIWVLVAAISVSSFAQDLLQLRIAGKPERASDELIDRSVRDANGELCAGLVIVSDLEGLSFDSNNGIVKSNLSAGRVFLFLSPGERTVTIAKGGYKPLKLILNDYGVRLKSGEVWQVQVTGEKRPDQIPVSFIVDQPGATIFIDGATRGSGRTHQVNIGRHELRIEKDGYRPITQAIDVSATNALFLFTLEPVDVLAVSVKSVPPGAKISLNNQERGVTDKGLFLYPGKYRLKLSLSGYLDVEREIDVAEGARNDLSFAMVKNSGLLQLEVTPPGAKVLINKEEYTGKTSIELPRGRYKVDVDKEGFVGTTDVVDVTLGATVKKAYTLLPRVGALQFSIQPLETRVKLKRGGVVQQEWQGIKFLKGLQVGEYDVECSAPGYAVLTRRVRIEEGKTGVEDLVLKMGSATGGEGMGEMVLVEGGTFEMGSNDGGSDEKPVHRVTLSSFYLDKYEVTVGQYRRFCDATGRQMPFGPSWGWQGNHPMVNVTWDDASAYAKWAGRRLPTEAEWEYAARGGNRSRGYTYSGSNSLDDVAWYDGNSGNQTHPVGKKQPNEIGLYDMSGNVWEWCADWYYANYYTGSPASDPKGPTTGQFRLLRGGSWYGDRSLARVAYRYVSDPSDRDLSGFRCAQDVK